MKPVGLIYDPIFAEHDLGPGQPECPERLISILNALASFREDDRFIWVEPPEAQVKDIARVHDPAYIDWVCDTCAKGGSYYPALEGTLVPESYPAALKAAGAVILACDRVRSGEWGGGFAIVRPPGHHAVHNSAMGFCIFNNIAIGAKYLLEVKDVKSILIVDFDVHHGNGTQDAFYSDGRVAFFSTHQFPHYPGTGSKKETGVGEGSGATLNAPLQSGSDDGEMLLAFADQLIPWAEKRKPEIFLISAGFDAHSDDPLSALQVSTEGYRHIGQLLKAFADKHCQGRWVATLEGGYNLTALGASVKAFLEGMVEDG
ncbi:MAG: histone deacetylase [bacterium]|nr:histone deacetylase [bacterium]